MGGLADLATLADLLRNSQDMILSPMAVNPNFLVTGPTPLSPLQRSAPRAAKSISPNSGARRLLCLLDGVLSEPRAGRDVGAPLAGAIQFLVDAKAAGFDVFIHDERSTTTVWAWLQRHSPVVNGAPMHLEEVIQICNKRPKVDVVLDACALRFDGQNFPTIDELTDSKPWHC
jgi:hypothetical protein